MSKYIDADKLKAEIERQMKYYDDKEREVLDDPKQFTYALFYQGHQRMCAKLLSFLDTLSEEPDKSLEEEMNLWISENENIHHGDKLMVGLLKDIARYFAEWQKSQMLKDAVEAEVSAVILRENRDEVHYAITYPEGKDSHSITDKVRIVVLKEEEDKR